MGRGKAWFSKADFNLAQAWSQASHAPIVGNMQDGKTFWQTIKSNFMNLSRTNEERSISSLQSRWSDINKKTTKFNGTYHQIKRVQRSGNEDKYIEETLKLYKDEMGEEFIFVSIWHFLKDKPEWKLQAMKKKEASKKEAPKKEAAAATTTTTATSTSPSTGDVVDVDADEEDCSLRPIGQKKAKELRNSAQRQLEIDEKAAQAMQSGAETHKFNLEFELFSSMGDTDEAKEWRGLVAQQILLDRKKAINAKKRVAEAEEACLKKKKEIAERLKKEVTPSAIEFDENEEENKENESRTNGNEEGEEEEVEESSPPEHCINNVSGTSSSEKSASSCCPLDLCHFANDDEEDVTFPLRNKCVMCKGFCHASCSKYAGQFVLCRLCDKKKERV